MTAATAVWGTMTGIRRTSASDTLRVIVLAYADLNPAGENGVNRVEFTTVVNGGAPSVTSVSSPTKEFPNYSLAQSPLVGSRGGAQREVFAYSILLDCNALAQGRIVVTANVVSNIGTVTAVTFPTSSIILYNDKGGADSRPNTNVVYWSWETGSDTNTGLLLSAPKKNLRNILATYGPNVGGIDIVALPGIQYVGGEGVNDDDSADFFTSDHWWANVICLPGTRFRGYDNYPNFILAPCQSTNGEFRLRFWGDSQFWEEDGFSVQAASGRRCHIWIDGGYSQPTNYDPAKPWSVLYANRNENRGMVGHDGAVNDVYKYCTSHTRRGINDGFSAWSFLQDVKITDVSGIYFQPSSPNGAATTDAIINADCTRHRYADNETKGYIRASVAGVANITFPSPGVMRLTATGAIFNLPKNIPCTLHGQLEELVGATHWRLNFSGGFPSGCTGTFNVIGSGLNYVEVANSNPGAVAGPASGGATIATVSGPNLKMGTGGGTLYETAVHTDVIQTVNSRTGSVWYGIRTIDTKDLRGFCDSGGTLTRCVLVNCSSAVGKGNDDMGAAWVDSLFLHNNLHHWNFGSSFTRCNFVDNVCDHATNFPSTGFIRNNHFFSGSASGANFSQGIWYAADVGVSPWALTPTAGNLGTSSGLLPGPIEWRWPTASGDSKGVWNISGAGTGASTVTMSGQAFSNGVVVGQPEGSFTAGAVVTAQPFASGVLISPPTGSFSAATGSGPVTPTPIDGASGSTLSPRPPKMSAEESLELARARLALIRSVKSLERSDET